MIEVHVVPQGDAWALEVAGDQQESFDTRVEAIRRGRELAEQGYGTLVIHGKGGPDRRKGFARQGPRDVPIS
jgi:hypothetical protein